MAISHIGSNTQDSAGAQSLTFTVPAATQTDDLILVFVKQSENTGAQVWDDDGGGGNGYTRAAYNRTTSGRDQETAVYWKFATSNSEANPTFTWNSGGTNEPMSGIMEVYRDVDKDSFDSSNVTHINSTNDANPPNAPAATIEFDDSWVVVNHAATHDDISTVAAPTGFTLRSQIWAGTANDHRNNFTADISNIDISADPYTPPDWGHSVLNTTPEYHCYTVVLPENQPIVVSGGTLLDGFNWGDTNLTITGKGFGATQGTGKVEIWDDTSGTTKTVQTIDSWSDTSIQIDTVRGSLPDDSVVYVVVTAQVNGESNKAETSVGLKPYNNVILDLDPDHAWRFAEAPSNSTPDQVGTLNGDITNGSGANPTFPSTQICEDQTTSMLIADTLSRVETPDSINMNTSALQERTMGGWIMLGGTQESLACIYEEGGGVNNICFIAGIGNALLAQLADTADDLAQGYSNFALKADRPYHIIFRYSYIETTQEFVLFIDGIEQARSSGNPLTSAGDHLDSHSGDIGWGDPDGNLEVGGTDVAFNGPNDCYYAQWATWSENSSEGGFLSDTQIKEDLFRRGALPDDTVSANTEANMQTTINGLATTRPDYPLSVRIETPTDTSNPTFSFDGWDFDAGITEHLEWRGTGTLTILARNGSNFEASKCFSAAGGTITIVQDSVLTLTNVPNGAEIRVYDAGTTTEIDGVESETSGSFSTSISNNTTTSVDIRVVFADTVVEEYYAVDLSGGDVGIPLSSRTDRTYSNPV